MKLRLHHGVTGEAACLPKSGLRIDEVGRRTSLALRDDVHEHKVSARQSG
jgi:hypothetical protein